MFNEVAKDRWIEPRCRQVSVFHENHCDTQLWARAAH